MTPSIKLLDKKMLQLFFVATPAMGVVIFVADVDFNWISHTFFS
jgi:hypothetical protein